MSFYQAFFAMAGLVVGVFVGHTASSIAVFFMPHLFLFLKKFLPLYNAVKIPATIIMNFAHCGTFVAAIPKYTIKGASKKILCNLTK